MEISGFTIIRNAEIYDFPIVECIQSALDLVDEFVVVAGDSKDNTDRLLAGIISPKLRIIHTQWDTSRYSHSGMIYAHQTDIALQACSGDWCLYLQSDEVLHHDSVPVIRQACEKFLDKSEVEGFVLKYKHIYADYRHYIEARHFGYPREIRLVRNRPDIHSWRDAQSFRCIPDFDYTNYWQRKGTRKLSCVLLDAWIFHYGWSRDPRCMVPKMAEQYSMHAGSPGEERQVAYYEYGNVSMMPEFRGTHPKAMETRIAACSWLELIRQAGLPKPPLGKFYGVKYRIVNFIEKYFLPEGVRIGGFKNYRLRKGSRYR